jgi:TPR repeat protein
VPHRVAEPALAVQIETKKFHRLRVFDHQLTNGSSPNVGTLLAANEGSAPDQYALGELYEVGFPGSVDQCEETAVMWYLLAAKQGHPNAQVAIARCYLSGTGVKIDLPLGMKWLQHAARLGQVDAQHSLAIAYSNGQGWIEQNDTKALYWSRRAAEQGHVEATANAACFLSQGLGAAKDAREAVRLWRIAAEKGSARAQYNLGLYLHDGVGVTRDFSESVRWMEKAAAQGLPIAQTTLAKMLG